MDVIQPMQMIHAEDFIQAAVSNLFRFSYGLDPYSCLLANGGHCLTSDHRGVFMDLTIDSGRGGDFVVPRGCNDLDFWFKQRDGRL